jgi:hypothetical protein
MTQWKLVPVEPTEEMIKAVNTADCHNFELSWAEGYKAMLDAAPVLERVPESSGAYDMLDRFLRNSLDDTDYAEYSDALETVLAHVPTAQPAPDVQPVAWQYKKEGGGIFASDQCPADIEVWNDIEWNKPLYTHPPAAAVQDLVAALMIIAGKQRCVDSLMSNVDIALEALKKWEGK